MKKRFIATFLIVSIISGCNTTTYNDYDYTEETEQVQIVETEEVKEVVEETTYYYNVPLSHDVQDTIFRECERHSIAPAIIIAMIERESYYDSNVVGDNGNSLGLMQIQPRWHKGLMKELNCDDLFNPHQNVTVGINIIANLKAKDPDVYWVLMAYNGGQKYATKHMNDGNISDYAKYVVERSSELQNEIDTVN